VSPRFLDDREVDSAERSCRSGGALSRGVADGVPGRNTSTRDHKMRRALTDYPDLLTVEEAADYLRISRALGYQLARQYRITDGEAGLPVVQLGRCLRVPRDELALLVRGLLPKSSYVGSKPA
jgi:excisionase family DNA binding protein